MRESEICNLCKRGSRKTSKSKSMNIRRRPKVTLRGTSVRLSETYSCRTTCSKIMQIYSKMKLITLTK